MWKVLCSAVLRRGSVVGWERWKQILCRVLRYDCGCSYLLSRALQEALRFLQPCCSMAGLICAVCWCRQLASHLHEHFLMWLDLLEQAQGGCCNQSSCLDLVVEWSPAYGTSHEGSPALQMTWSCFTQGPVQAGLVACGHIGPESTSGPQLPNLLSPAAASLVFGVALWSPL